MKPRLFDPIYIFIGLIVLSVIMFGIFLGVKLQQDPFSRTLESTENVTVLFAITDENNIELTQVLIFNKSSGKMAQISIPNNLGRIINQLNRVDRVGVLYEEQGIQAYRELLTKFLGTPIHHYLIIEESGLSRFTDLVGGLPVFLEHSIDTWGEDADDINRIPNGNVVLDGDKVLDLLGFVQSEEQPAERTNRQFTLTQGFFQRLGTSHEYFSQGVFQEIMGSLIESDLELSSIEKLSEFLAEVDYETPITQRILGTERLVQTGEGQLSLLFPHFEGKLVRDSVNQIKKNLETPDELFAAQGTLRVEVLNGTRINGLARRTSEMLQNQGIEVVEVANADQQDVEETQIIYHTIEEAAQRVGAMIRGENIIPGSGENENAVDVTVILGKDFDGWYVRPEN